MNIIINTAKFKADEKLEKYINDKVSKLDRMIDRATKCEVFLKIDKPESENNKIAELQLALPGQTLFIGKQADTFEQAVSEAVDAMKVQIEKYKNA
jgi:putative sigma-54 modulation protein